MRSATAPRGMDAALRRLCARAESGGARPLQHHHPLRPHGRARPHPDPCPARHRGGAPSPDPQGAAHLGRPRRRDRRSARGPPLRLPRRLRRRGDQPLSRASRRWRRWPRTCPTRRARTNWSKRYIKAVDKGLLKVMSKMGISTYQSYCGAQIFDAVGLSRAFVDEFFSGTATRIEGAGLAEIAEETARRHADAFGESPVLRSALEVGGEYAYRLRGEAHCWTPQTVSLLQHAVRGNARDKYDAYAAAAQRAERAPADDPRPVPPALGRRGRPQAGPARRGRVRRRRSSGASRPARCRSARSRARRTRRWRSR